MIIERLSREHRNIEKLLAILERELEIFDRGDRPVPASPTMQSRQTAVVSGSTETLAIPVS